MPESPMLAGFVSNMIGYEAVCANQCPWKLPYFLGCGNGVSRSTAAHMAVQDHLVHLTLMGCVLLHDRQPGTSDGQDGAHDREHTAQCGGDLLGDTGLDISVLYNISPFHPLHDYPGPLLWKATRLTASYHHATGDLYKCIAVIHDEYGRAVRIAPDEVSFSSPSAFPAIYNARPQLGKSPWHFGPANEIKLPDGNSLPESLITAPDAEHTRLRKLITPAFLNAGIAEVEPVLQKYTDLLCKQLAVASKAGSQNMVEWLLWTLNDVIGQLALDQEFQCLELRRMHPWPKFLLSVLKQTAFLNQFRRFGFSFKLLTMLAPQKLLDERDEFMNVVYRAVNQRLAREKGQASDIGYGNDQKSRPDLVGLMLRDMRGTDRLSEPEVISNSILIIGGGAETTSTCLSATLYHLCKAPHAMQRLKDEIRGCFSTNEEITITAISDLPYLKAVIDESLRIFPVASYITPRVIPEEGHIIDGHFLPGGTHVPMGQFFMGRSGQFFDDPREFRPERWLEGNEVQKVSGMRVNEILKPFSMGPRNCIGKQLALTEARLVTAKLIWHFDMELDGLHQSWVQDARYYGYFSRCASS
ncbi:hypothetical protein DOTSEDRAFT_82343 [Dothistroma septosporum NZE10]|uniref:Isotrichodermin C-15 hydroxylase n=1 Tax=Dothistroma septosporum (strain NZE10 / CBS 128990) TaxID=675120 RepID=N1PII9_DOTSN|nr:hypothetical protein DOTSEDRAFT_82343 [Dothistroma septosporum NZE10]